MRRPTGRRFYFSGDVECEVQPKFPKKLRQQAQFVD
jgi:hypothetical protein